MHGDSPAGLPMTGPGSKQLLRGSNAESEADQSGSDGSGMAARSVAAAGRYHLDLGLASVVPPRGSERQEN